MSTKNKQIAIRALKALKLLEELQKSESRRNRSMWVRPFLLNREEYNIEEHLMKDLLLDDEKEYKNFCRMSHVEFEEILNLIEPSIKKCDTRMRFAISPRIRLAITLRFIATGDSYRSLEFLTRVSRKTISSFIPEVLTAIYCALEKKYMMFPKTEEQWLAISDDFDKIWDFPNTLGAIDGKHIRIKCPGNSGSEFFNYKGFFSVVLLAIVNAHSKFLYIDVGTNGRASDTVVLKNSSLYQALEANKLNIPPNARLRGQAVKTPFFFIGDDIFPLQKHLMKGYNKNINLTTQQEAFNYRISRTRMTVEMAFGRLVSRFRIFHRPIEVKPETVDLIVKVCCVLHNYLSTDIATAPDYDKDCSEKLPETVTPLTQQETESIYKNACIIRDSIALYLITHGDVDYQWKKIKNKT